MASLKLPNGEEVEIPDGYDPDRAMKALQRLRPEAFAPDTSRAKEGLLSGIASGARQLGADYGTAFLGLTGQEGLARKAVAAHDRQEAEKYKGTQYSDVEEAFKRGYFGEGDQSGGLATLAKYWRDQFATSLAPMGATLGGARLGAMAGTPFGPVGSVVGGVGGALAANYPMFVGSNLGRQIQEQQKAGVETPLNVSGAAGAALPQAGLDVAETLFLLGRMGLGKNVVEGILKRGSTEAAEAALKKKAEQSLLKTTAKGAGVGAAVEIPTEVAQQILERWQAGLSLTDADARKEYEATAVGVAAPGAVFGGAGAAHARSQARDQVATTEAAKAAAAQKAAQEQAEAERVAREADPAYRAQRAQELVQERLDVQKQITALQAAKNDERLDKEEKKDIEAQVKELRAKHRNLVEALREYAPEAASTIKPTKEEVIAQAAAKLAAQEADQVVDEYGNVVEGTSKSNPTPSPAALNQAAQQMENEERIKRLEERERVKNERAAEKEAEKNEREAARVAKEVEARRVKQTDMFAASQEEVEAQREELLGNIQDEASVWDADLAETVPGPIARRRVLSDLNRNRVSERVQKVLGIKGLEGKEYPLVEAEPARDALIAIEARIAEIEASKAEPAAQAKLGELQRLRQAAMEGIRNRAADVVEEALVDETVGKIPFTKKEYASTENKGPTEVVPDLAATEEQKTRWGKIVAEIKREVSAERPQESANKEIEAQQSAQAALDDIQSALEDLLGGDHLARRQALGELTAEEVDRRREAEHMRALRGDPEARAAVKARKEALENLGSKLPSQLKEEIDAAKKRLIEARLRELELYRKSNSKQPLTEDEAIAVAVKTASELDAYLKRALAPTTREYYGEYMDVKRPAVMRSHKIVEPAWTERRAPIERRPEAEQPFPDLKGATADLRGKLLAIRDEYSQMESPKGTGRTQVNKNKELLMSRPREEGKGAPSDPDAYRKYVADKLVKSRMDDRNGTIRRTIDALEDGTASRALTEAADSLANRLERGDVKGGDLDTAEIERELARMQKGTPSAEDLTGKRQVDMFAGQARSQMERAREKGDEAYRYIKTKDEKEREKHDKAVAEEIERKKEAVEKREQEAARIRESLKKLASIDSEIRKIESNPLYSYGRDGNAGLIHANDIAEYKKKLLAPTIPDADGLPAATAARQYAEYRVAKRAYDAQLRVLRDMEAKYEAQAPQRARREQLLAPLYKEREAAWKESGFGSMPLGRNVEAVMKAGSKADTARSNMQSRVQAAYLNVKAQLESAKEAESEKEIRDIQDLINVQLRIIADDVAEKKAQLARNVSAEGGYPEGSAPVIRAEIDAVDFRNKDFVRQLKALEKRLKDAEKRAMSGIQSSAVTAKVLADKEVQAYIKRLEKAEAELKKTRAKQQKHDIDIDADKTAAEARRQEEAIARAYAKEKAAEIDRLIAEQEQRLASKMGLPTTTRRMYVIDRLNRKLKLDAKRMKARGSAMSVQEAMAQRRRDVRAYGVDLGAIKGGQIVPGGRVPITTESKQRANAALAAKAVAEAELPLQEKVRNVESEQHTPAGETLDERRERLREEAKDIAEQGVERRTRKPGRLSKEELMAKIKELKTEREKPNISAAEEKRLGAAIRELTRKLNAENTLLAEGDKPGVRSRAKQELRTAKTPEVKAKEAEEKRKAKLRRKLSNDFKEGTKASDDYEFDPDAERAFDDFRRGVDDGTVYRDPGSPPAKQVHFREAKARMDALQNNLPDGVRVVYAPTMADAPQRFKDALARRKEESAKGVMLPDGEILIVGNMHEDLKDLEETVAHELIGHYTVDTLLGPEGVQDLVDRVFSGSRDNVYKMAAEMGVYEEVVAAEDASKLNGLNENATRMNMVREMIAHVSEKQPTPKQLSGFQKFIRMMVNAVRNAMSRMGFKETPKSPTQEIYQLIKDARKAYEENRVGAYRGPRGSVVMRPGAATYDSSVPAGVRDTVGTVVAPRNTFTDKLKSFVSGLRVNVVDKMSEVQKLADRLPGSEGEQMMYNNRNFERFLLWTHEVMSGGPLKLVDEKQPDGRTGSLVKTAGKASLKDVVDALAKAAPQIGNAEAVDRVWTTYLAAKRVKTQGLRMDQLNVKNPDGTPLSMAQLEEVERFGDSIPAFKEARRLYNEYNAGLVDFAEQAGAISAEDAKAFKRGDYVPFYRTDESGNVTAELDDGHSVRIGNIKQQPFLHELVGSEKKLMNFTETSMQNTALLTDLALRNIATKNMAFTLHGLGLGTFNKGNGPAARNVMRYRVNGEDHHIVIDANDGVTRLHNIDEALKKQVKGTEKYKKLVEARAKIAANIGAFDDINPELLIRGFEGISAFIPDAIKMMRGPSNLLRKGVTRFPTYVIRNLWRDSASSWLTTGVSEFPLSKTLKNFMQLKPLSNKETDVEKQMRGMGMVGGQVFTGDPEDALKLMRQMVAGQSGWEKAWASLDRLSIKSDTATRMTLFNDFRNQGMSELQATLAVNESMNYYTRGASASMHALSTMIPFMNAQLRGLDVVYKAFAGKMPQAERLKVKEKLYKRGALIAASTMAYAAMMQDDDAYKKADPYTRYTNWFIRIPGLDEPLKVPVPFEMGYIFKSVPEMLYQSMGDDASGAQIMKAAKQMVLNTIPGGSSMWLPQAVKPAFEVMTNHSIFLDRPIETPGMEAVMPGFRTNNATSAVAKELGKAFNISPVMFDYLVRAYTGNVGQFALTALGNPVAELVNPDIGGPVNKKWSENALVGALFQSNEGSGLVAQAYDIAKNIEQAQATFNQLIKEGRIEEAKDFRERYAEDMAKSQLVVPFKQQMGELFKLERIVRAKPEREMGPEEKERMLDMIKSRRSALAEKFTAVAQ